MGVKQVAAFAAALFASAPSLADDVVFQQTVPMTMFYVSIPLGATTAKQQAPTYGFALQGKRQYETVLVDSRMFTFAEGLLAGIEAKWLIAGALAVGGGVYLANKDKGRSDNYSGSQNRQQNSPPPPPPCDPDCKK
ncbi:MAG TPA: hypothetical protein VM140_11165 [Burkholderiales bacterium]|nr:hypothetical protein [Burkholderiales bacterium]